MEQLSGSLSFFYDFLAGGISGAIAKSIFYPNERIKLILIYQELKIRPCTGIWNCCKRVLIEQDVLSLWKGNKVNVVRYFPLEAINFSVKDFLNRKYINSLDLIYKTLYFCLSFITRLLFAYFIVLASETIAHPFYTVRRRLMLHAKKQDKANYQDNQLLFKDCIKRRNKSIIQRKTLKQLTSSLILVIYDEFQRLQLKIDKKTYITFIFNKKFSFFLKMNNMFQKGKS